MIRHISSKLILILFLSLPNLLWGDVIQEIKKLEQKVTKLSAGEKKVDMLNDLGLMLFNENSKQAKIYNQEALVIAERINYAEGIGEAKRNLGMLSMAKFGNTEETFPLLQEALEIAEQNKFLSLKARTLFGLGSWYEISDTSGKCVEILEEAMDLLTQLEDEYWLVSCYLELGWYYHTHHEDNEKAESYMKKALMLSEKPKNKTLLPKTLKNIAALYYNQNINYFKINTYLERGLQVAKETNQPFYAAQVQMVLGATFYEADQKEMAMSHYRQSLAYFESVKNYSDMVWIHSALIRYYIYEKKDYDLALEQIEKYQLIIDHVSGKDYNTSFLYACLATVYLERDQDYEKALEYYFKSSEAGKFIPSQQIRMEVMIGKTYVLMGEYQKGLEWCEKKTNDIKDWTKLSITRCECLVDAYQNLGQYQSAFNYQQQLSALNDTIHKEELFVKVSNLELKENHEKELAQIGLEKEQSKTKTAWIIGGMGGGFLTAIMFLYIAYVKKAAQKKQLMALAKLRRELIANVSHDLRTPIAILQGYAETLLMKKKSITPETRDKYTNIILKNSEKLSILSAQLFDFSKLETQQFKPQKEPFYIDELLKHQLEEYQILANKKGIELSFDCSKKQLAVYADISLIGRVVQNLIDNALKFTPEKGRITICLKNGNNDVQVSVVDEGRGIKKEDQALIFNRNHKAKDSKGAGLGLAIVKRIIELHESKLQLKSELGKGAKFFFSLPLHKSF